MKLIWEKSDLSKEELIDIIREAIDSGEFELTHAERVEKRIAHDKSHHEGGRNCFCCERRITIDIYKKWHEDMRTHEIYQTDTDKMTYFPYKKDSTEITLDNLLSEKEGIKINDRY